MRLFIKLTSFLILLSFSLDVLYAFEEEKCKLVQVKSCIDTREKIIDGVVVNNQCWEMQEKFLCLSKEKNNCNALEANRGCHEITANCIENSDNELGLCKNLEKKFSCGNKFEEKDTVKHIDTKFHILKDEKDLSSCSKEEIDKHCEILEENCIEPKETRNINGKDVHKDCWKWDRKYSCRSGSFVDECKDLPQNCKLTGKTDCLHSLNINGKQECDHLELEYQCSENHSYKKECFASKFCIGGVCEQSQRTQHNDFANSISGLSILASMKSDAIDGCKCPEGKQTCEAGEIDSSQCKLFTGGAKQCSKAPGRNCCKNSGSLKSVWDCSQDAKDLFISRRSGLCHHVGSWKGKKIKNADILKKYESHCCFKSKMAKIIQVQGRKQLGIGWGDKKNPDCRALTLEEIQNIDFNKIDFSELFHEMESKARSGESKTQDKIKNTLQNTKGNSAVTSELIKQKINKFYSGAQK